MFYTKTDLGSVSKMFNHASAGHGPHIQVRMIRIFGLFIMW
ncbi:Uncharacterised protein [Mycobacteroides abscessus subsp. abscessus]|nr:Uncharacterised protein [Mycobacteroides abscessus subsp. abscessus]